MSNNRILIVDDQEDIRILLRLALEPMGCELYVATNGHEAIDIARRYQPDLIILDVMMPGGMDGHQVCRVLRAEAATAHAYIILLSARGQQSDLNEGKQAGADHYMLKPFSPIELTDIIRCAQAR